jgi:serine/threonine-protein kinase
MASQHLGKYELIDRLGRGGMGEVWKARDTQLQRYVAIKLLHADLQSNPDFVTHFMREAQLVASLHHPNIVQVHDFQLTDVEGSSIKAYMVMDYIEGGTLSDYIRSTSRRGLFPPAADILYLFTAISLALDYAHDKGMIHRDIKPANILLDRSDSADKRLGEPILTDFGIARLQGASTSTVTQALLGTPLYISPEQAEGDTLDKRSDLYSLGIVLYEILTGITPFRGDSPLAIMTQHVHIKPPPPALINPNIPPALSDVVLKSIAKKPDDRYPNAAAMTIEMAQAFNLPVPASLLSSKAASEVQRYNPLQPSRSLSGQISYPPTVVASPLSQSPLPSQPGTPSYAPYTTPVSSNVPSARPKSRRGLYLAITFAILFVLLGVSAFLALPSLLSRTASTPTPGPANSVVGQITFLSSAGVPHNTFDQLRIDLTNIPPPPTNTTYYAWLEKANSEASLIPNWKLQISQGAIHGIYSSDPPHTNLYAASIKFLITTEAANSQPITPNLDRSSHRYYANITQLANPPLTFDIKQCPSSSSGNATDPCP